MSSADAEEVQRDVQEAQMARVLVIDDEETIRYLLGRMLEQAGGRRESGVGGKGVKMCDR